MGKGNLESIFNTVGYSVVRCFLRSKMQDTVKEYQQVLTSVLADLSQDGGPNVLKRSPGLNSLRRDIEEDMKIVEQSIEAYLPSESPIE